MIQAFDRHGVNKPIRTAILDDFCQMVLALQKNNEELKAVNKYFEANGKSKGAFNSLKRDFISFGEEKTWRRNRVIREKEGHPFRDLQQGRSIVLKSRSWLVKAETLNME